MLGQTRNHRHWQGLAQEVEVKHNFVAEDGRKKHVR